MGACKFVCKWMHVSNVEEKWCHNVHCSHACIYMHTHCLQSQTMISFSSSKTHKHQQTAVGAQ